MEKLVITGGNKLHGTIAVSGAKNVALKALVAACLTEEEVTINNIPHISDFFVMVDIMKSLGAKVAIDDHVARISLPTFSTSTLSLEDAVKARTSAMFIAPLLARLGKANVPNPGGCRLGARPIDRIVQGIQRMGAEVSYDSEDGYFHAKATRLHGIEYTFLKSTHTGTETLLLAAVLAQGKTVLKNAAEEPEIDELIAFLNAMGAQITRTQKREITIEGVEKLHGASMTILPDRNEIVTFAIAGLVTGGDVMVKDAGLVHVDSFLEKLEEAGAGFEKSGNDIRFFHKGQLTATNVTTAIHPGFMTDWQAPWAVLMTQAVGTSIVHETVFENKLSYVNDLKRMGAKVELFNPEVLDKESVYNFNLADDKPEYYHGVKVTGPTNLHEFVATTIDIRAGAAVVLAALAAKGTSSIFGVEKLDRGYEKFEERLRSLGAEIERVQE